MWVQCALSLYGRFVGLSRLQEFRNVPVHHLRLFPLRDMAGFGDHDEPGLRNRGLEVAADLRGEKAILFAPEDQGGMPDLLEPGRKVLLPRRILARRMKAILPAAEAQEQPSAE